MLNNIDSKSAASPEAPSFPIVGIGASAGGIEALLRLFGALPVDSGLCFVVVMHLSPDFPSKVDDVLRRVTDMPIFQVTLPTLLQANCIYILSPATNLTVQQEMLQVTEAERHRGHPVAIDLFFRSLAEAQGPRSVGVILSGAGSDGVLGVSRIKECAGITIAQSPDEAGYPEMPQNAIATGMVDIVLPVPQIAAKLVDLWQNARNMHISAASQEHDEQEEAPQSAADPQILGHILHTLQSRTGHDFQHYKRATVLRRIERRLKVNTLAGLADYSLYLDTHPAEADALLQDLLIGVTAFFRDGESFDILQRDVLPLMLRERKQDDTIRAWSVGCSTGEEVYSLGMMVAESRDSLNCAAGIQLFATDIDEQAIRTARTGTYLEGIHTDVSGERLKRFFVKSRGRYVITKSLRDCVLFAPHNILRDPPFSRMDIITCRNLLIYLDRAIQRQVLQTFFFALKPGGYLFLGSAETADIADDLFLPIDKKNRIYRAKLLPAQQRSKAVPPLTPSLGVTNPTLPAAAASPSVSISGIQQRALNFHAPVHLIVDCDGQIIHQSERVGQFLRFVHGEPTHELFALLIPELRLDLRTAFFQATRQAQVVEIKDFQLVDADGVSLVDIVVAPYHDEQENVDVVLITFAAHRQPRDVLCPPSPEDIVDPRVFHLEQELAQAKAQLALSIEQGSVSVEDLKASNEELQAIVEELRSTGEELETGKEEMQSVNEELTTVNLELQGRVEDTAKANDDLENLLVGTGIVTLFLDRRLCIKRFSASAVSIFNLIESDIGRPLSHVTHNLAYPELPDDAEAAFSKLKLIEREVSSRRDNWFLARLIPYRTADDRIDGVVLTFIDITARRQAQAEARDKDERLKLAAVATNDYAILVQDMDGLIVNWNRGAERVFGYAASEAIGRSIDLIFTEEDVANNIPAAERETAKAAGRAEDERWHQRRDGVRIYCSGVVTLIDTDGFKGFAKIARDTTDKKTVENQQQLQLTLERTVREQAEESNRLKDEFFAVLSHELKNPLNLIHVKAELLTRAPTASHIPIVREAADAIQRSVIAQAKIIDDLLDLSRVRTGKLRMHFEEVDLAAVLKTVVSACLEDALTNGVEVEVGRQETPVMAYVDAVRYEQMIWNLLRNALKFTPTGGRIKITIRDDAEFAHIEVTDTGRGISPKFLPRLFDMFSQEEGGGRRDRGGLGIGLSLVKQLAELHGGGIEARSDGVGHGASFTLTLAKAGGGSSAGDRYAEIDPTILQGKSVLLVDDAVEALTALQMLLEIEGASVVAVTDGEHAIDALANNHFDLILSDIGMPAMSGYELIRRIRAEVLTAEIRAIALTGFGRERDAQRALAAGFDAHLGKPVSLNALLAAMTKCFS